MSSVPAVYAELLELFTAALPDVQVVLVGETTLNPVVLMIGKVEGVRSAGTQNRIRSATRNLPFQTSQDEYSVEIFVSISRPGTDIMSVINEADAVWETAREAVEVTGDLDVTGVYEALPTGDFEFIPEADANGRYVTVKFGLDVTARD